MADEVCGSYGAPVGAVEPVVEYFLKSRVGPPVDTLVEGQQNDLQKYISVFGMFCLSPIST